MAKFELYSTEKTNDEEKTRESIKDTTLMKTKWLTVYLIVNCNFSIEICFLFFCTRTTVVSVFYVWSMTPIELAHAAEGRRDRSRQASNLNISSQERYLMNVLDESLQLACLVVLTYIYIQNPVRYPCRSVSIYLLPMQRP